jgi:hypothetical protein
MEAEDVLPVNICVVGHLKDRLILLPCVCLGVCACACCSSGVWRVGVRVCDHRSNTKDGTEKETEKETETRVSIGVPRPKTRRRLLSSTSGF